LENQTVGGSIVLTEMMVKIVNKFYVLTVMTLVKPNTSLTILTEKRIGKS
jgi:hypothetical protein